MDPVGHDTQPKGMPHLKVETPDGQVGYFTFHPDDPEGLDIKAVNMKKAKPQYIVSVYDVSDDESVVSGVYRELVAVW